MARRKDGRPRVGIIMSSDFVRSGTRKYVSLDCRDGQHDACDADGGCTGCGCHFVQE